MKLQDFNRVNRGNQHNNRYNYIWNTFRGYTPPLPTKKNNGFI